MNSGLLIINMDKEIKIKDVLKEFEEKLPKFSDGRIDYSHSDKAPVLTCFVRFRDKILLLKRSSKVRAYQGKWNTVAGYLDESKPIREKVFDELKEELGILQKDILRIKVGLPYEFFDSDISKTWIVHPALVELKQKPNIKLNFEHTEYKWINPFDIKKYKTPPAFEESLRRVLL